LSYQGEELEPLSVEHLEDPPSSSAVDDEAVSGDSAVKLAEVDTTSAAEPISDSADDANLSLSASSHPAEGPIAAEDACVPSSQPTGESEVDFSRLDIDAEQLVASLFGDDDSSVSFEQPPTDNKKGFVSADHEDAAKWFYQDPQGVIQGEK